MFVAPQQLQRGSEADWQALKLRIIEGELVVYGILLGEIQIGVRGWLDRVFVCSIACNRRVQGVRPIVKFV